MDKQRSGDFIAQERKAAGLTQRELAGRLHVTDKAVSKWERALSYPDVTLLEPLAEALGLGVEELMACRRIEREEAGTAMQDLLELSRESLRTERRTHLWKTALALLLTLAAVLGAAWHQRVHVHEQRRDTIFLKETEGAEHCLYVEEEGHLLRLRCGEGVDFDGIAPENERGGRKVYRLDCLGAVVEDIDQDGHNEVVVRTRWPEKPYTVYDWGDDFQVKEIRQYWPESVPPELEGRLIPPWERQAQLEAEPGRAPS